MKENTKKIVKSEVLDVLKPILEAAGFSSFKKNCAFRNFDDRIDVIELHMAAPGHNVSHSTPKNSFSIEAGVFFKFAPHPMDATFEGEHGFPIDSALDGHFRISSKPSFLLQNGWNDPWWRVDSWVFRKRFILPDVKKNIEDYLLPWFDKFNDLSVVYEYIMQINSAGIDIGDKRRNADSWGGLYEFKTLPAFFQLQLENWNEAKKQLQALLEEPHPGFKIDPEKNPEKLYHNIEDMLKKGLAKAEANLS